MNRLSIQRKSLAIPDGSELVPGVLQMPRGDDAVPGVLLLHGFSSRKERMADTIGRALGQRGVAALSVIYRCTERGRKG